MLPLDLSFGVLGAWIPAGHGYLLYSAVKQCLERNAPPGTLERFLGEKAIGLHPISGMRIAPDRLCMTESSRLKIRTPADVIPGLIVLAGRELNIGGSRVRLGVPTVHALEPATTLRSPFVTIKGFMDPETFVDACRRQLRELEVRETVDVAIPKLSRGPRLGEPIRRVMRIRGKLVVGFGLTINGLTKEESAVVQACGIGGRRRLGAGIFVPCKVQS